MNLPAACFAVGVSRRIASGHRSQGRRRGKEESRTTQRFSLQNYFRLYEKISGMTGTAQTSAEEFHKVYNLES